MRYLFTLLSFLVFVVCCRHQDAVLPLDTPVTFFSDLPTTYQALQDGSAIAGRLKRQIHNGELNGEWRYNERGQLLEWRSFRFDEIASAVQYRYDASGRLRFVQRFDNNCVISSIYNCKGPVAWTSYDELTTDTAGRVSESKTYLYLDGKWELRSIATYAYDAQGQMTKVLRYDDKQVLMLTQTLTYDARGNVISLREQSTVASADLADRTVRYDYDTGRNPYFNTVYYASAFFLSRNTQVAPELTYEYRSDGLPTRIRQKGSDTVLEYY